MEPMLLATLIFSILCLYCANCIGIRKPLVSPVFGTRLALHHDRFRELRVTAVANIPRSTRNGLASVFAAAVVKFALQPFDTLKTLQQMDRNSVGLIATTSAFISKRGVLSLWTGAGVTVLGSAPSVALYFSIFNFVKVRLATALPARYKPLAVAVAAAVGNTAASVLRSPYDPNADG